MHGQTRIIACVAAAFSAAPLAGQNPDQPGAAPVAPATQPARSAQPSESARTRGARQRGDQPTLQRATRLLHDQLYDPQGRVLGNIEDLAVDTNLGQVGFVLLSATGTAGTEHDLYAIPIGALRVESSGRQARLVLEDAQALETASGFSETSAPDMSDPRWIHRASEQFNVPPYWRIAAVRGGRRDRPRDMGDGPPWPRHRRDQGEFRGGRPDRFNREFDGAQDEFDRDRPFNERDDGFDGREQGFENRDERRYLREPRVPRRMEERRFRGEARDDFGGNRYWEERSSDRGMRDQRWFDEQEGRYEDEGRYESNREDRTQRWGNRPDEARGGGFAEFERGFDRREGDQFRDDYFERGGPARDRLEQRFERRDGGARSSDRPRARRPRPDRPAILRASQIIGQDVRNHRGLDAGEIRDLIVDLSTGRIPFTVLSLDGVARARNRLVALPWQALEARDKGCEFVLHVPRARLRRAETFDEAQWPDMASAQWAQDTYEYYGIEPDILVFPMTLYGEPVSSETQPSGDRLQARQQYSRLFDRSKTQTFSGTIRNILREAPQEHMKEFQIVTLQTQDGRTVLVHLAPASWLQTRRPQLNVGDQITILGAPANVQGRQVILAETVEKGDSKLRLRHEDGRPVWMNRAGRQRSIPDQDMPRRQQQAAPSDQ